MAPSINSLPTAILAHALSYLGEEYALNQVNHFFLYACPLAGRIILVNLRRNPQLRAIIDRYRPPPLKCSNWNIYVCIMRQLRNTFIFRNQEYRLRIQNINSPLSTLIKQADDVCFTRFFRKIFEGLRKKVPCIAIDEQKAWMQTHGAELARLTNLDLARQVCTKRKELRLLTGLTCLNISWTRQWEVPDLQDLKALQTLYLTGNHITNWLGYIPSLKALYLNQNELTTLPPPFAQHAQLQILNLKVNAFQTPPLCISHLPLKSLNLSLNPLTIPPSFVFPSSLRSLSIASCDLNSFPPIKNLVHLEHLNLSNNAIPYVPKWIKNFRRLHTLKLANNHGIALCEEIGRLTRIRHIDLSYLGLNSFPNWMQHLIALEVVRIGYNPLTQLPPMMLFWTHLTELYMPQTRLEFIPSWIMWLNSLELADFSYTPSLVCIPLYYFYRLPHFEDLYF